VQGTLTETLPRAQRQRFRPGLLKLKWAEVLEPRVLPPALVMLLCLVSFGAVLTVVPDQSRLLGLVGSSKGLFYICYTVASLLVRLGAGKASDVYGRVPVLRGAATALAAGLALLVWVPTVPGFLAGAVVFGLSTGLLSPTLYAWTIDLSQPAHRGRAVATMYIALEAGIGLGALAAGWIFSNQPARLPYVHGLSLACVLAALAYLLARPAGGPVAPAVSAEEPEPAAEEVV